MPISGLVLTLNRDESLREKSLQSMKKKEQLMLGPIEGQKVPAVLETSNKNENKELLKWLESLPGIHHIDVVYVSLEEEFDKPEKQRTFESLPEIRGVLT